MQRLQNLPLDVIGMGKLGDNFSTLGCLVIQQAQAAKRGHGIRQRDSVRVVAVSADLKRNQISRNAPEPRSQREPLLAGTR